MLHLRLVEPPSYVTGIYIIQTPSGSTPYNERGGSSRKGYLSQAGCN